MFPVHCLARRCGGPGLSRRWEGLFINTLLPLFAAIAAVAQGLSWWQHRRLGPLLLGLAGPALVLATLFLFWSADWSTYLFYVGIAVMLAVSVWDLVRPARPACASCDVFRVAPSGRDGGKAQ